MRALAPLLLVLLVFPACAGTPEPAPGADRSVVASLTDDGSRLTLGEKAVTLGTLDPWRVARLARAILPGVRIEEAEHTVIVQLDSPESADALLEAALWTDALVKARRSLEATTGPVPRTDAGVVAEAIRRWILPEPPGALADWGALSAALENESVWQVSPETAGMGSVIFAGMILRGESSAIDEDRARRILSRAVAMRDVPGWLTWVAYSAWNRRDLTASEESP